MKKATHYILLCILCSAFINTSFAQFTLTSDASVDTLRSANGTFSNIVTNTGTSSIYIVWNVDLANTFLPSGWLASACDNNTCPPWSGNSHNSSAIAAGAMSSPAWTVDINSSGGSPGTAWVTENLVDNNGVTHKTAVYVYSNLTSGVTSVLHTDEDVILYPNPAVNELNVIFNSALGIKSVAICNLIGKPVSTFRTMGNSAKLTTESLASGIYFVRLMDANSNVVTTRKFTKL